MYSLSQLRRGFSHPKYVLRELNRYYHTRFRQWDVNETGVNVFEEDWDNLLILDAFRYDTFAELADEMELPGRLESRYSRGACTAEFIRGNVDQIDLTDIVYVAATTMLYRESVFRDETTVEFHDVVDVWRESIDLGEWGVRPETMAESARKALADYPDKRLVVHFLQPHIPFIGPTGEEYEDAIEHTIWKDTFTGSASVSDDVIRRAYRENARIAMAEVIELLPDLPGKTVITADHGQYLGERSFPLPIKEYGHPNGIYTDVLTRVPWHVYENGERRDIVAEESEGSYGERQTRELDEKARNHLEQLGYLE